MILVWELEFQDFAFPYNFFPLILISGGALFSSIREIFFAKFGSDVPKSEFSLDRSAVPEGHFLHPGGVKFTA